MITEVLELYYNPGVPSKDGGERSTWVKVNQKQKKEIEIDLEIILEDLIEDILKSKNEEKNMDLDDEKYEQLKKKTL
ncbi:6775_t:CDS:2, partial [Gigaspora rosea]